MYTGILKDEFKLKFLGLGVRMPKPTRTSQTVKGSPEGVCVMTTLPPSAMLN